LLPSQLALSTDSDIIPTRHQRNNGFSQRLRACVPCSAPARQPTTVQRAAAPADGERRRNRCG
jgi:hypothetical protein